MVEGCDDVIRKPFRESDIFDILSNYLGVRFVYEEEEGGTRVLGVDGQSELRDLKVAMQTLLAELLTSTLGRK